MSTAVRRQRIRPGAFGNMYICRAWMYKRLMATFGVADARNHLPDVIDRAQRKPVFIDQRGRRAAVVLSADQCGRMLEALEDAEDVAEFDESMAEVGPNIPWTHMKVDLGWT